MLMTMCSHQDWASTLSHVPMAMVENVPSSKLRVAQINVVRLIVNTIAARNVNRTTPPLQLGNRLLNFRPGAFRTSKDERVVDLHLLCRPGCLD